MYHPLMLPQTQRIHWTPEKALNGERVIFCVGRTIHNQEVMSGYSLPDDDGMRRSAAEMAVRSGLSKLDELPGRTTYTGPVNTTRPIPPDTY